MVDYQQLYSIVQFTICFSGMLANMFLASVIVINRELRKICGTLIMTLAIYDAISEFNLITLPMITQILNFTIPVETCFYMRIYGPIIQTMCHELMTVISIDRLIALIFPLKYRFLTINKNKSRFYIIGILISIFVISLYQIYFVYVDIVLPKPERQVFCTPKDMFPNGSRAYTLSNVLMISCTIGSMICYSIIFVALKNNEVLKNTQANDRRVFKSLYVIMSINFVCYIFSPILNGFLSDLSLPADLQQFLSNLLFQSTKVAQAINAPILYICSTEYRTAMKEMLRKLFCCRCRSNSIRNDGCTSQQVVPIISSLTNNRQQIAVQANNNMK